MSDLSFMERRVYDLIMASPEGVELVWSSLEKERSTRALEFDREREAMTREREAWSREREAMTREREAWMRERELLIDREASAVAGLLKQIDFSEGLITVRSMLEGIVTNAFPNKSVTEALRCYCEKKDFVEYLALVSAATNFSTTSLIKSAKGAYGMMSQTVHSGSTQSMEATVPQSVVHDKCTLHAIAAMFKFERRDVRFYIGGPSSLLKIPLPPRSVVSSVARSVVSSVVSSAANSA